MGNLDLTKSVRATYKARKAFGVHNTRRHREQTSLKDNIKAMWFCLKEKFFVNHSQGETITSYSSCGKTMKHPVYAMVTAKELLNLTSLPKKDCSSTLAKM